MENVNLKVNGIEVSVPQGSTILEAAKVAGVNIPTLCYMKEINAIGACRICVVEVKGARSLVTACVYPVAEGMEVTTNSPKILESRKTTLELILSTHEKKCLSCDRNQNCELQALCYEYGVDEDAFMGEKDIRHIDNSTEYLVRDSGKCILCRKCEAVCKSKQAVAILGCNDRGISTHMGCEFEADLADSPCVACGQCVAICPTGALVEKSEIDNVVKALNDPEMHVVVGPAPAVRVALGEEFGMPYGTNVKGKLAAALRKLGFDKVFDVDFAADLTIMEEGTEFISRLTKKENLPLITSCSPGWIKYCEHYFPEFIPNLSSCKSPQQMFGAVMKSYYAEKMGIDREKVYVVSIMPCIAKKFEKTRKENSVDGLQDIDAVLTTRELARLIKRKGIDFASLNDEEFDNPLGESTGAAVIFGTTGGVMEAALRTVVEVVTGKESDNLEYTEVRGLDKIKEATYNVNGIEVKVAVASGLANAKELLTRIKNGQAHYDFIEIMGCEGGCINGAGQPYIPSSVRNFTDVRELRMKAIYDDDKNSQRRKSHENPAVKEIYANYFGEPNSHKAHHVLHTTYVKRELYK